MVKYAWSGPEDDRTWGEVLDDLETAGAEVADFKFFTWADPKSGEKYSVVAYVEGEEEFPDDFDEDKARAEFFKDIFQIHRVGV